ncbi:putative nuclease HARBI1 [Anastrepha ludens]|uniref:putative nuclease HARBI1 n=1 Tax=Anastrepha ludens TaxID=28586 RepID=UPI0023B07751|nr:putative nuclease HARBI1 [Anastrepha ludens]
MTVKEENKRKEDFYRKTKILGVVGCVDCTHISIQCPKTEAKYLYKNNIGIYSINALIICDANLVVRYVDAIHPGENEDSFVWEIIAANEYFKSMYDSGKRHFWLIGDLGF